MIRYCGYYASRSRAQRKIKGAPGCPDSPARTAAPPASPRKRRWAALIARVFEIDPLVCPRCGAALTITAFVVKTQDVERLLAKASLPLEDWPPATGPPAWWQALKAQQWIDENPGFYPEEFSQDSSHDDLTQSEVPNELHFTDEP